MKIKGDYSSLVIAGFWNYAIFNDQNWIKKFLLPDDAFTIEVPLYVGGSLRFSTQDLRIFLVNNMLQFAAIKTENEVYTKIEGLAIKLADYLTHTPVSAFGINFSFILDSSDNKDWESELQYEEELATLGFILDTTRIVRTYSKDNYKLNLSIIRELNGYSFDFNYHFDIKSLVELKGLLEGDTINTFKNTSIAILSDLFRVELT